MNWTRLDNHCAARSCPSCWGSGFDPKFPDEHRCCGGCGGSGLRGGRKEAQRVADDYAKNQAYWDQVVG